MANSNVDGGKHRRIYRRAGDGYPSDVRTAEWARMEPLIPEASPGGRPRKTDMRAAVNAILYLLRTGCRGAICPATAFRRAQRSTTSFASSSVMASGRQSGPSCIPRKSGSRQTRRWSKGDSNRGSHPGFHRSRRPVRDEERRHRARRHRCIRRRSASRPSKVNIAAIRTALRRCRRLVLNDHAYDKLTGWSNVIPVVPVKGDATETYKFIKEESHGTRSTPHRYRT